MTALTPFLTATEFIDFDHAAVQSWVATNADAQADLPERVVQLYYATRDGFRYTPWGVASNREAFRASAVLTRDRELGGHCIDKALVLAASARCIGVPSRLHFANVRNHIGTADLEARLGTDLLVFHGYVELWLHERWVAATPAFNRELCEHLGVEPLEFDGRSDSIFQQYDRVGGRFMDYVHDYGTFAELPFERMCAAWKQHYGPVLKGGGWPKRSTG